MPYLWHVGIDVTLIKEVLARVEFVGRLSRGNANKIKIIRCESAQTTNTARPSTYVCRPDRLIHLWHYRTIAKVHRHDGNSDSTKNSERVSQNHLILRHPIILFLLKEGEQSTKALQKVLIAISINRAAIRYLNLKRFRLIGCIHDRMHSMVARMLRVVANNSIRVCSTGH
jgi:hypothetical protein